jgi:hypothetical protein
VSSSMTTLISGSYFSLIPSKWGSIKFVWLK